MLTPSILLISALFGLRNPGDGGRQVVTINPANAAVAPVSASIAPPNGTPSGVVALDREGDRFFFTGTPSSETTPRLYAVSTATGAVLSSPAIEAGTSVLGLEYDEAEDVLYGLRTPAASASKQLVRFAIASGAATPVGPATASAIGMPSGVTALDANGNRFFFAGTQASETTQRLYTIDTATGAVVSSPLLDAASSITGLEYDDADGVLYGLRTPADGGKQVVALNPATGAATVVSPSIGPSLGIASGVTALDGAGNRFYFVATPSGESDARIYTVHTANGALLASPTIAGSASQFFQGLAFEPAVPAVRNVLIDVIPQKINPRARGVIPVVVLSTPTFDATRINPATVRFGPGNTWELHGTGHVVDHDKDGDKDLLFHFGQPTALIPCGATSVSLTGQTTAGQLFTGFDAITTIGCK